MQTRTNELHLCTLGKRNRCDDDRTLMIFFNYIAYEALCAHQCLMCALYMYIFNCNHHCIQHNTQPCSAERGEASKAFFNLMNTYYSLITRTESGPIAARALGNSIDCPIARQMREKRHLLGCGRVCEWQMCGAMQQGYMVGGQTVCAIAAIRLRRECKLCAQDRP